MVETLKKLVLLFFLIFVGCKANMEPVENYSGAIVCLKAEVAAGNLFVIKTINPEDSTKLIIKRIYVLDYDYKRTEVGDTLK